MKLNLALILIGAFVILGLIIGFLVHDPIVQIFKKKPSATAVQDPTQIPTNPQAPVVSVGPRDVSSGSQTKKKPREARAEVDMSPLYDEISSQKKILGQTKADLDLLKAIIDSVAAGTLPLDSLKSRLGYFNSRPKPSDEEIARATRDVSARIGWRTWGLCFKPGLIGGFGIRAHENVEPRAFLSLQYLWIQDFTFGIQTDLRDEAGINIMHYIPIFENTKAGIFANRLLKNTEDRELDNYELGLGLGVNF